MSRPHQNDAVHSHAHTNPPTTLPRSHAPSSSKSGTYLLSLILKAIIMSLLTSLFFLFLGLAAIFLLHLFLASRQFHLRTRRRHTNFRDRPTPGLSSRDLQNLPGFRYNVGVNDKKTASAAAAAAASVSDCVICLEEFKKGDFFRVLPDCKHVFHTRCVDSWLVKVPSCPICRGNVGLSCVEAEDDDKELWEIGVS